MATKIDKKKNELEQKILLEMERTRTQVAGVDTRTHADAAAQAQPKTPPQFDGTPEALEGR